jgi:peroxiredoxin
MSPVTTASVPRSWQQRIRESRLGTVLVLAVTAAIVVGGAYLVDSPKAAQAGPVAVAAGAPKVGSVAPDFTATTVAGKKVSLSSYRGHPVWLTFGASWCAACVAEAPDVEAAYQKFKATGLVVLEISKDEDAATVKDYATRVGLTFPMVADPNERIVPEYQAYSIPAHFFIDRSGIIRSMALGGQSPEQMATEITEISR